MSTSFRQLLLVIPTRNRADLAITAARSVKFARCANVRVAISDNSTEPRATDKVRAACSELRMEYWRPDSPLSMSAHWEWAIRRFLQDPTASHLSFLTDRMVVRPPGLRSLLEILTRFDTDIVSYAHDRLDDSGNPVELAESPWTGRLLRLSAKRSVEMFAATDPTINMALPRLLNAAIPRRTLREVEERFGAACGDATSPDFAFAFRCLASVASTLYYDRSVLVHYAIERSNGASVARGLPNDDHRDFVVQLDGTAPLSAAPIPNLLTVHNAVAHEYELIRSRRPDWPAIVWGPYLNVIRQEVEAMQDGSTKTLATLALRAARPPDPGDTSYWKRPLRLSLMRLENAVPKSRLVAHRLLQATAYFKTAWRSVELRKDIVAPTRRPIISQWPSAELGVAHVVLGRQRSPHVGLSSLEYSAIRRFGHPRIDVLATIR